MTTFLLTSDSTAADLSAWLSARGLRRLVAHAGERPSDPRSIVIVSVATTRLGAVVDACARFDARKVASS